ncbi:TerB family tellurite resistance protein [Devosia chinhatensis]|uniref:Co-chaperone DjlA N-terminal domain-containing protein n=1 Tax=Devosia chinhatensis TaxID=429727 RepID=A0A0F5FL27_9HYPH|nr:TerB family tellurite resistance protein [Devosia chinhatensis]KKB08932.1 hypothetical protein VE26_02460 [Devosia chinhatensis]
MTEDRYLRHDALSAGTARRREDKSTIREVHQDAGSACHEDFFQALVAGVAVIAHVDGRLELAERRLLVQAFVKSAGPHGFSVTDLAQELADHSRTYDYDPSLAESRALAQLAALTLNVSERQAIRQICQDVIIADGVVHPVELGALYRVEKALGIGGGR